MASDTPEFLDPAEDCPYASDDERSQHAKGWPKDTLPAKEKPPFNRDWRLPKGPF